jgi:hypothetical protein
MYSAAIGLAFVTPWLAYALYVLVVAEVPEGSTELQWVLRCAPWRGTSVVYETCQGLVPFLGPQCRTELISL